MEPIALIRGLVHVIELKKIQQADPEELYGLGLYVPLVTASVLAPGIFIVLGVVTFLVVGVAQFYPAYELPADLLLTLGAVSWVLAAISFGVYNFILKQLLRLDVADEREEKPSFRENLAYSIEPILEQLKAEQKKMF